MGRLSRVVFRKGEQLYIQSRDLRPLNRYFPELYQALLERLPQDSVVDGEIVIATERGLDFDLLQLGDKPDKRGCASRWGPSRARLRRAEAGAAGQGAAPAARRLRRP